MHTGSRLGRRALSARPLILLVAALLALTLTNWLPGVQSTAQADTAPATGVPSTVSTDPLPTVQIDGVVWSQIVVGNTVYVGGSFTTARPAGSAPGEQIVARSNFLAYNLTTGELLDNFAPSFNAQVRSLAVSPDQQTLYVGGQFTQVNGVNRYRIVAFNLATGAVRTSFAVTMNSTVYGVAATADTVYLTGIFTIVNGATRNNAAAVEVATGAVRPFAVTPAGGSVRHVAVSPDGAKVVLAGNFTSMNGSSNPGYGMAMVSSTTGTSLPLPANALLRNGNTESFFTSLVPTPTGFYGTGYSFSRAQGNVEGAFLIDWDGNLVWIEDCHGDTYSVAVSANAVYVAGHPHECSSVGSFPQTNPWTFHRALAFSRQATGVSGLNPNNYLTFAGKPTPTALNWYPDINAGTFTGQSQGPWSVAANDDYVLYGGEFTEVNGTAQQGLVRFAKTSVAPNDDGPRLGAGSAGLTVRSYGPSALRVSWPANWDRDNERIEYRLFRNGELINETGAESTFYYRRNLSFLDTTTQPGESYTYKVKATDPLGNSAWSSEVSGTSGTGAPLTPYQRVILADGPEAYWPLNETSGTSMTDLAGSDPGTRSSQVSQGVTGAIVNDPATAFRLSGASSASTMVDTVAKTPPEYFSTEAWFKTTSNRGGQIIGLSSTSAGGSAYADRHIYLTNSGQVYMAVRPSGQVKSVGSTATFRDGNWHHVVGTISAEGMALYVDGVRVGSSAETKAGQAFGTRLSYWKMGGDNLSWVTNKPTSNYLAGDLDEMAFYPVALTPAQVKAHYDLAKSGVAPNVKPKASFTTSVSHLKVSADGSESTDTDGTIASYAWDFGDGAKGTGATADHTYAEAGTYTVSLTVTDDRGGTHSVTRDVTVTEPPNQGPTAAFTVSSNSLTLSVDGSDSSDPDGQVTSYAWDFGDGESGTGETAQHEYGAAGSYVVKLTVNDDDGATNAKSQVVTVPSGAQPFALDEFNRNQASGLGSADLGGTWTAPGASGFAVAGGDGIFKLSTAGASRTAYLPEALSNSSDTRLSFTTDKDATGGGIYATVLGRRVSATDDYRLNLRILNTNKVTVSLGALKGSATATSLSSTVSLPGTYAAGTDVHVRFQSTGTSPTTVRAKVWLGSDSEPDSWTVTATDSYAGLQAQGSVGLIGYLSGSATNAPVNLALHRLVVTP